MNSPTLLDQKLPEGIRSAWQLDCITFADAVAPDAELTVSEWADAKRVLSEMSAEPGPWRTQRVPYAREIMDALSVGDPCQEVVLMKGTQVAGTEIGNNWIGYIIDVAPGPAMMVMPTSNTGKRSSKTRLAKMIESTPALREKISERSRDKSNSTTLKEFAGGALAVAGANSAAELKSMPIRFLFMDELDEYPDDVDGQGPADELAEKRTDTFVRKKIYKASTPTVRGRSKIETAFKRGDQRRYYVPCPHCKAEQVLKWSQVRWDTRRARELHCTECGTIAEAAEGADVCTSCGATAPPEGFVERDTGEIEDVHYECGQCAEPIPEFHKTWMLESGRWIAESPGPGRPKSYHLSALYSPLGWFSWRDAVRKRLEADKDPTGELLKVWTNTVIAETYSEASEQPSDLDIKHRAEAYRPGSVPMGGLMLSASVDVQVDRIETVVKAWGRGEESWLVQYQVIHGDTETDAPWAALDEFLQLKFKHESGAPMRILAAAVDSGFRTQKVYDFCRRRVHRHVFPVKGMSREGKAILGRPTLQDVTHRGETIKNGVALVAGRRGHGEGADLRADEDHAAGPGLHALAVRNAGRVLQGAHRRAPGQALPQGLCAHELGEGRRRAQRAARPRGVRLRRRAVRRRGASELGPARGDDAQRRRRPLRRRAGSCAGRAAEGAPEKASEAPVRAPAQKPSNWVTGFKR
jgi:phage terminase large subunit GpA-like protein